jgi:hypothetical protein
VFMTAFCARRTLEADTLPSARHLRDVPDAANSAFDFSYGCHCKPLTPRLPEFFRLLQRRHRFVGDALVRVDGLQHAGILRADELGQRRFPSFMRATGVVRVRLVAAKIVTT